MVLSISLTVGIIEFTAFFFFYNSLFEAEFLTERTKTVFVFLCSIEKENRRDRRDVLVDVT